MDFGTTRVVSWMEYDNVDGDLFINYNCFDVYQEPITVLLEEFLKNPTLQVGNDEGDNVFQSIVVDNNFTTALVVEAKELGDYMTEKNVAGDAQIKVLAKRAGMSEFEGSDPVASPLDRLEKFFFFPKQAFLDDDFDFSQDIKDGFDVKLIQQTRNLVLSIQVEPTCIPDYEQVYKNVTDVGTPIIKRGELLKSFPRTKDLPEDKTNGDIVSVRNRELEFSDPKKPDVWEKQDFDGLTKDFNWVKKLKDTSLVGKFASDDTTQGMLSNLLDFLLGTGDGLPEAEKLLDDLVALDNLLIAIYDLSTDLEDGLVDIYDLIVLVLKIEPKLKEIQITLKLIDSIAALVGIIKQTKPIVVPIRNALKILLKVLGNTVSKVKKISKPIKPYKSKVRTLLIKNEKFRSITAKTAFVNQNYLLVPTNLTRNCKSTDDGAKVVNDAIDEVEAFFLPPFNAIENFSKAIGKIRESIAAVLKAVEKIFRELTKAISNFDFINTILGKRSYLCVCVSLCIFKRYSY
jgi:hypothetical protein